MAFCVNCDNDVFAEFQHCYNEESIGRKTGEWMRCKKCNIEIDLDTFYGRLDQEKNPISDVPIDFGVSSQDDASGQQNTELCLKCEDAVFENHVGSAQDDAPGHQKIALCLKCDNALFEDFEHFHKNGEKESMKCKRCRNVIDLDTFTSRLGREGPPALQGVSPEDLEAMKLLLFSGPCSKCDNDGEPNFTFTFDEDDVILARTCNRCKEVMGLDNGMTSDQINQLLTSGKIRVKTCACGNDDPDKMTLEQKGQEVVLICSGCGSTCFNLGDIDVDQRCDLEIKLACNKCSNKVSELFSVRYDDISGKPIRVTCLCCDTDAPVSSAPVCPCGSRDPEVTFDQYACVDTARCAKCKKHLELKGASHSGIGRTQILSPSELRPGDHVAWQRALGYWHHAIVSEVDNSRVRVIEYGMNEGKSLSAAKGIVKERWFQAHFEEEVFYRIEYRKEKANLPCNVIERARTRIGETEYWVFSSNCEHFATWAKTGRATSEQVANAATYFKRVAGKGACEAGEAAITYTVVDEMATVLEAGIEVIGVDVIAGGTLINFLPSSVFLVMAEAGFMAWDIWGYHSKHRKSEISSDEFKKMATKRVCRGIGGVVGGYVGGLAGAAAGTVVGAAIGGPIGATVGFCVGKVIGQTLGYLIGSLIGNIAGRVAWKKGQKRNK